MHRFANGVSEIKPNKDQSSGEGMESKIVNVVNFSSKNVLMIRLFGLGLASCITSTGCQSTAKIESKAMNNGAVVENPYEDPTVVRMYVDGKGACTATLVEEGGRNFILTAAHCIYKDDKNTSVYSPNRIQFDIKGSFFTAVSVIPHPKYKGDIKYDIGLVFLDPSVRFPSVRKLGSSPRVDDLVTIDGYGVFSMSYVMDDDDGDGMPNGRDYCPNTEYWKSAQIDSKGCAFDQWPSDFPKVNPVGAHASGIRRRGSNYIGKIVDGTIFLRDTFHNGRTQTTATQVASGDSGGPLLDRSGRIIGVTSVAQWNPESYSVDAQRSSGFSDINYGCNLEFIRTGKANRCDP